MYHLGHVPRKETRHPLKWQNKIMDPSRLIDVIKLKAWKCLLDGIPLFTTKISTLGFLRGPCHNNLEIALKKWGSTDDKPAEKEWLGQPKCRCWGKLLGIKSKRILLLLPSRTPAFKSPRREIPSQTRQGKWFSNSLLGLKHPSIKETGQ